jgi:uncharacterized protein
MDEAAYRRGVELFNRGEFFEAHEVLEDVWRAAPVGEKLFLQGLIQLAVGLHHYSTGNLVGASSLLARGNRNLGTYPQRFGGIELADLRSATDDCSQALERGERLQAFPRIKLTEKPEPCR